MEITIYDIEQVDPERIKLERDLLVEAIVELGVSSGLLNPDVPVEGAHLLMLLDDIADILEQQKPTVLA